jgi:hypothetical protein
VKLELTGFGGIMPKMDPRMLSKMSAQTAENCQLMAGILEPLPTPAAIGTLALSDPVTIFPYRGDWLCWATDVDVVRGPLAADQYERIYYTGDGVPKMRCLFGGIETVYPLGIPKPSAAPTVSVSDKTATTWTRQWHYQFEESDGSVSQSGDMTEGADITQVTAGSVYTCTIPTRTTASASAVFVLWCDAYSAGGTYLGRLYPTISKYSGSTTLSVDGALVAGGQVNTPTIATMTFTYDTSSASDYSVDRAYVYTFLSALGEEGPPSDPSSIVTVSPTQDANLSAMDAVSPSGYNITKKRIYRTVTGQSGTAYKFVAEIDIATATYSDTMTDSDTAEELPSIGWNAPLSDLKGLRMMPGGFLAAFSGKTVYFSEAYYPHAWPDYGYTVDYDIVGIEVTENSLIVVTTGTPYLLTGSRPDAMQQTVLNIHQACVSKRSICRVNQMVMYASPDGLIACQGTSQPVLMTAESYSREDWQELTPANILGVVHDGQYLAFHSGGCVTFDMRLKKSVITTVEQTCSAAYSDLEDDTLYFATGTSLMSWVAGSTKRTATWRSRIWSITRPMSWSVIRVRADAFPVTVRLYAAGVQVFERAVASDRAQRLPVLRDEMEWEAEIIANTNVHVVMLSTSMSEL